MTTYVPISARINLCTNPSFEANTNDWSVASGSTVLSRATNGYVGTYSAQATVSASVGVSYRSTAGLPVSAGQAYTLSGYFAQNAANAGSVSVLAYIAWYDSSNNFISNSVGSAVVVAASGSYSRLSASGTAPSNAAVALLAFTSSTLSGTSDIYYLDAILFEQAGSVGDYFDGNSTTTALLSNAWLGAANNSTSVQTAYVSQVTPTTYRYLFADLVTNQIQAELPLTGVSFTTTLNGIGSFQGSMLVTDATQTYLNIWGATQPARTALYIERFSDGGTPTLVWGGIIWARDYDSNTQKVTFNGSEFESYFDRRRIISNTTATSQIFKNVDPILLASTLITNAQNSALTTQGNIGVVVPFASTAVATTATSGTGTVATVTLASAPNFNVGDYVTVSGVVPSGYNGTYAITNIAGNSFSYSNATTGAQTTAGIVSAAVSKTYFDAELKTVLSAVQDLSKASNSGFDFKILPAYDGANNPTKTLQFGWPRLGTAYSATNPNAPVFEFPGNVISYTYFEDGSLAANFIFAVGVGNGQGKLNKTTYSSAQWSAGWPLLEASTNYGDVTSQSLLTDLAQGQLNAVQNPPVSLKIVYAPYQDPILGSYSLGDDVRVRINDDRAGQTDDYYRVVAISVSPGENNQGERAILTLTQKGAV